MVHMTKGAFKTHIFFYKKVHFLPLMFFLRLFIKTCHQIIGYNRLDINHWMKIKPSLCKTGDTVIGGALWAILRSPPTPTHTIVAEKNYLLFFCLLPTMGKISWLLQG